MTHDLVVRLELEDETILDIPVDIDFSDLTADQVGQISRLYKGQLLAPDGEPAPELGALCLFSKLDRPDADFEIIGPVLTSVLKGSTEHLIIEHLPEGI